MKKLTIDRSKKRLWFLASILSAVYLLTGCSNHATPRIWYEQKVETFEFTDQKALTSILGDQSAMGWEVSASAFDPKTSTLVVFFKRPDFTTEIRNKP